MNVFLGSKASRTPSKIKTNKASMIAKVKKAVNPNHGACKFCLACNVNSPSEGAVVGRPKPKKSKLAKPAMVPVTINGSIVNAFVDWPKKLIYKCNNNH